MFAPASDRYLRTPAIADPSLNYENPPSATFVATSSGRPPRSHALVDQPGEEAGIDDETAELGVKGSGRLGRDRFIPRHAFLFERRDILAGPRRACRGNSLSSALLLTGFPCPGMMIVLSVAAARFTSDAAIMPSMLPPVE